ncbi:ribosome maturation factor RimP [Thalassotalea litorea]|uniref:ribosome maturation factor RimP n=1 Tax=Thalassotalea litorea TaxID=2020715 RepID=UPI003736187E
MSNFEQKLTEMLRPAVEMTGMELLGIEYISAGNHSVLRLYIDHENGVNVDNCADVSRQVSAVLDVEDPISTEYNLEVSSPGVDRPLFEKAHYLDVVGETVDVKLGMPLNGRRKFKGILEAVEGDNLIVEVDGESYELPVANVAKANLIAKF